MKLFNTFVVLAAAQEGDGPGADASKTLMGSYQEQINALNGNGGGYNGGTGYVADPYEGFTGGAFGGAEGGDVYETGNGSLDNYQPANDQYSNNNNQAPAKNNYPSNIQYNAAGNNQYNNNNYQAPANNYNAGAAYNANNDNNYPAQNPYGGVKNPGYQGYPSTGLKCWRCHAKSFEECAQNGYEETCQSNQESCELEIRERSHVRGQARYIESIMTGCKQKLACANNQAQNFQNANPDYTQCRPEAEYGHSVCRQCCEEDNCVKSPEWWYPTTRSEWAYTGESNGY